MMTSAAKTATGEANPARGSSAPMTVLRARRLIDGISSTVIQDAEVQVVGDQLVFVGRAAEAPAPPPSAGIHELGDRTLMPGLIDAHTHVAMPTLAAPPSGSAECVLVAVSALRQALHSGVTTVRDCGAPLDSGFIVRDAIARGLIDGPRMLTAGRILCTTGGHGHFVGEEVDGPDGVCRGVRRMFKEGADFIKVTASGGSTPPRALRTRASFSAGELRAAVEEASQHNSYVTAHCHATEAIERCLEAGVPMLEHATFVAQDGLERYDEHLGERLAEQGVVVVPTVSVYGRWVEHARPRVATMDGGSREMFDSRAAGFERRLDLVSRLHASGVTLLAGSDAGHGRGYPAPFDDLAFEMALHVDAGVPVMDVIRSATAASADALGIDGITGRLRHGLAADVIAVDGDPTSSISALASVVFVMAAGVVVRGA